MTWGHATTPIEVPVFVTADGRTRRTASWLGRLLGLALAAWLAAVIAGGTGFASMPQLTGHLVLRASGGHVLVKDSPAHDRGDRT
jgi:hypothetical protein